MGPSRGRQYNSAFESTFSGTVVSVLPEVPVGRELSEMSVRTDSGQVHRIRLAPRWYLDSIGLDPKVGDQVQVTAAPSPEGGPGEMLAREVILGGKTYQIRTGKGMPTWAGAGHLSWSRYPGMWNPAHMEEVTGEIVAVESVAPGGVGMGRGVALRLRTRDREQIRVHLGPAWYIDEQSLDLKPGQEVTVKGSSVGVGAEHTIIASEIIQGQHHVGLRAGQGRPEWAGGWQNWEGWGGSTRYGRRYNPKTVTTVTGVVEEVGPGAPMGGFGPGSMLTMRTRDGKQVRVHLGPVWFMEQSEFSLKPGEEVTLTGSQTEMGGKPVIMAREVEAGGVRLMLRDENGVPAWFGQHPDAR
jgi:hypothetical protein